MRASTIVTASILGQAAYTSAVTMQQPDLESAPTKLDKHNLRRLLSGGVLKKLYKPPSIPQTRKLLKGGRQYLQEGAAVSEGTKTTRYGNEEGHTTQSARTRQGGYGQAAHHAVASSSSGKGKGKGKGSSKGSKSSKSGSSSSSSTSGDTSGDNGGGNGNGSTKSPSEPVTQIPSMMMFNGYLETGFLHEPIFPNPALSDPFQPGTTTIFANEMLFTVQDNQVMDQSGLAQGQCIRIDSNPPSDSDNYEGRGYCQFTFEFFEPDSDPKEVIASLAAEGPVSNQDDSKLIVTAGSGGLFGATGDVIISPAQLDDGLITDSSRDFLNLPSQDGFELRVEIAIMPRFDLN